MEPPLILRFLVIAPIVYGCASTPRIPPGRQSPQRLVKVIKKKVQGRYLLYLPENYEEGRTWPLLLFLHGAGERGSNLDLVKTHGPPRLVAEGKDFPFVIVSPQCPAGERWSAEFLDVLLKEICGRYRIDESRIYVTGLSMGGFGTWELALEYPNRFAAIVPICGGGDPAKAGLIKDLPVWVFHGGKDPVVPLERSQAMVDALKAKGGKVKFTVYPDAGHDSWTETYNNPKLYEWLLRQHR